MALEYYYYGQGKVYSRRRGVAGAKWRWWGDVSALTVAAEVEKVEHKESYSGTKGLAVSFPISKAMTITATLHQLDSGSLAELVYGEAVEVAAGAVTGEALGTVAVGDIVKLDYGAVEDLVITDSTGSPVTIADTHYELDPRFGSIEFKSLPTSPAPVMPLKAAYSYGAHKSVAFFTEAQPELEFRYEGVNLAKGNAPVIAEYYRVAADPLQELALINNDTSVAGVEVSAAVLIDTTKPATGEMGQFGRIVQY